MLLGITQKIRISFSTQSKILLGFIGIDIRFMVQSLLHRRCRVHANIRQRERKREKERDRERKRARDCEKHIQKDIERKRQRERE